MSNDGYLRPRLCAGVDCLGREERWTGGWVRICLDRARVQSKVPLTFTLKKRVNSGTSTLVMSAGACTPTCHANLELAYSLSKRR